MAIFFLLGFKISNMTEKQFSNNNNLFANKGKKTTSNPFEVVSNRKFSESAFEPSRKRLNSIDSEIIDQQSLKEIDNSAIKVQHQIDETQKQLDELREKIKGAEKVAKVNEVLELKLLEKELERELKSLQEEYSNQGLKSKITKAAVKRGDAFIWILKIQKYVSRKILPKFSKKFEKISELSASLETLSSINHNIDDLMEMKVPYGETKQNYEKLTAYLNKANKIHAEINKSMSKF